ncbi:hypothetical protein CDAR_105551 [Caerostris darwini]|uniref:Uncharacterized protein n=1 Tax=Caerostris darwini TaxID=1538125 RepID=A0AAV4MZP2_9ARAC|nr:hypothetical protein CDAR_105551 [Caerostris darwini]
MLLTEISTSSIQSNHQTNSQLLLPDIWNSNMTLPHLPTAACFFRFLAFPDLMRNFYDADCRHTLLRFPPYHTLSGGFDSQRFLIGRGWGVLPAFYVAATCFKGKC